MAARARHAAVAWASAPVPLSSSTQGMACPTGRACAAIAGSLASRLAFCTRSSPRAHAVPLALQRLPARVRACVNVSRTQRRLVAWRACEHRGAPRRRSTMLRRVVLRHQTSRARADTTRTEQCTRACAMRLESGVRGTLQCLAGCARAWTPRSHRHLWIAAV